MARDKKNNKQNNKKNKKGQNQGGADQQQAQNMNQPPPLLTFGSFEEHKAAPAQAFQSKKGEKKQMTKAHALPGQRELGNKLKGARNNFMPKHDCDSKNDRTYIYDDPDSRDTDHAKEDEYGQECVYEQQQDVEEILRGLYDTNLTVVQHPTETDPGIFQVLVQPNCGIQTAGCSVELRMSFVDELSMAMTYEVLEATSTGLTSEQLQQLGTEIENLEEEYGDELLYQVVISTIEDFLSSENATTKKVIQEQAAQEELKRQKEREEEVKRQYNQARRQMQEFQKKQYQEFQAEGRWCYNLAIQQNFNNNSSIRRSKLQGARDGPSNQGVGLQKNLSVMSGLDRTAEDTVKGGDVAEGGFLDRVNQISRYANDFDEIEEIGKGGFGIVYKAQHKLDGNIYAIKKIKLSRNNEENKRILREIKYLSGLNNQYIVRYFQTWVEFETDPDIMAEFEEWGESEEEYGSSDEASFELVEKVEDDTVSARQVSKRSSSHINRKHAKPGAAQPGFMQKLAADNAESGGQLSIRRERAQSDQYSLTPDPKAIGQKGKAAGRAAEERKVDKLSAMFDDSEDDEELILGHEQSEDAFFSRIDEEESKFSKSSPGSPLHRRPSADENGIKILYIQMQFCEGETLETFLEKHPGKHQEKLKWKIFRQVLEAVNYLHQRDIIHRDIKPENIFLDTKRNARLGDFGLAKRINPLQQQQIKQAEKEQDQQPDQSNNCMPLLCAGREITTGLGTLRFAAPEQYTKGRKAACQSYGFKADIYSLGVVLLDMFRDHDISYQELNEIHESVQNEKVLPSLTKQMPEQAVSLIEKMIKKQASQRPTLLEILTSADLPQDEILEGLMQHLKNHKSSVKLQLFQQLSRLEVPKALGLQYNGSLQDELRNLNRQTNQDPGTPGLPKRLNKDMIKREKRKKDIDNALKTNALLAKIQRKIVSDLHKLFESNGASNLTNLPVVAPIPNERTIFISKPMRLLPWLKEETKERMKAIASFSKSQITDESASEPNFNFHDELCQQIGCRQNTEMFRLLTDDYLVMDGSDQGQQEDCGAADFDPQLKVKPLFDVGLCYSSNTDVSQIGMMQSGSCWQELTLRQLPELLEQKSSFKLLDQVGIIVGLQPELIDTIALGIAQTRPTALKKSYHIGQTYVQNSFAKANMFRERKRLAPKSETHACYTIVSPNGAPRLQTQTLSEMSQQELMLEVELIRTVESFFRYSKLDKYEVRVSSSELIDAIMDECNVDLADRLPLLQLLYELQDPSSLQDSNRNEITIRSEINKYQERNVSVHKLQELMKIRGSSKEVLKQVNKIYNVRNKARFNTVVDYFERLEEMLALFGLHAEVPLEQPQTQGSQELLATPAAQESAGKVTNKIRSRDKDIGASRQTSHRGRLATQMSFQPTRSASMDTVTRLVFDFGLLLEKSTIHYSGLLCCVSLRHQRTRLGKSARLSGDETLAYGGRFDNNVANFQQFEVKKYQPISLGMTFNCSEIASQIMKHESEEKMAETFSTVDFCITSQDDSLIPLKISLMQKLQLEGYRVHVDYSNQKVADQFVSDNNVRFFLEVLDETCELKLTDRYGYLSEISQGQIYSNYKTLLQDLSTAKTRKKRQEEKLIRQGRCESLALFCQDSNQ